MPLHVHRPKVLVVTPTYDEADNLRAFAEALFRAAPDVSLLVVDDASPDGTGVIADAIAAADPRVHVLHRAEKRGLGTAYVDGFRWALARDFDVILEMDADLSHDARYIESFLREIARGADVVVGSRNIPGGSVEGWGPGRTMLSRGGSLYARSVLGVAVHDMTTGFKAYTRRALLEMRFEAIGSTGYAFQIETTYRAIVAGLRLVEVPIVFVDRRAGTSKMSSSIVLEALIGVWRLRRRSPLQDAALGA